MEKRIIKKSIYPGIEACNFEIQLRSKKRDYRKIFSPEVSLIQKTLIVCKLYVCADPCH